MPPKVGRCADAGLGSRGRKSNTCAGETLKDKETEESVCDFHAQMRCFQEALRYVEGAEPGGSITTTTEEPK